MSAISGKRSFQSFSGEHPSSPKSESLKPISITDETMARLYRIAGVGQLFKRSSKESRNYASVCETPSKELDLESFILEMKVTFKSSFEQLGPQKPNLDELVSKCDLEYEDILSLLTLSSSQFLFFLQNFIYVDVHSKPGNKEVLFLRLKVEIERYLYETRIALTDLTPLNQEFACTESQKLDQYIEKFKKGELPEEEFTHLDELMNEYGLYIGSKQDRLNRIQLVLLERQDLL